MTNRILFVATEATPGMLPFASSVINLLSKNPKFTVYGVLVSRGEYDFKKILTPEIAANVTFIEYPKNKIGKMIFKFYPYSVIKAITKLTKKHKINKVHYLTGEFSMAFYTKFCRKKKYELYYTVHDLIPHETDKKSFSASLIDNYITCGNFSNLKTIKNITTSSWGQYEILKRTYPAKNVVFTHFPSLVTQVIKDGNDFPNELTGISNYILFFGFVDKYKGVDLLIKAYNQLADKKNYPLVIAGKGSQLVDNENGIIRINRFIPDSEIKMLFEKANCVVYPYQSATMSGVLSLAYYFGKKVLVSAIPFFLENIEERTLTFKPCDVEDLQNKLETLLKNEDGEYKQYSERTIINDYLKLYE